LGPALIFVALVERDEYIILKSIIFALQHLTMLPLPRVPFDEASCGGLRRFFRGRSFKGAVMAAGLGGGVVFAA
jgi:hypothetical protein